MTVKDVSVDAGAALPAAAKLATEEARVRVGDKGIGGSAPVFVIGEIGINHNGSVEVAKRLVAGSVRELDARVDDPAALVRVVARIGEPLFAAQPPTGYLDTAENWLSPGALLARIDFGLALASGQLNGVAVDLSPVSRGASGPEEVLDRASGRIGAPPLSEKTRSYILAELRDPGSPAVAARAVGLLLGAPEMQRR